MLRKADTLGGTPRSFNSDFKGGMGTGRSAGESDMVGAGEDDGDETETGTLLSRCATVEGEVELVSPELSSSMRRKMSEGDQYQYQYPVNCSIEN